MTCFYTLFLPYTVIFYFCSCKIYVMFTDINRIALVVGYLFPLLANSATPPTLYPHDQKLYDMYRHSAMYYYGVTFSDALTQLPYRAHRWPEHIQSLEYSYTLHEENPVRRFFKPLVGVVQLAVNGTLRVAHSKIISMSLTPTFAFHGKITVEYLCKYFICHSVGIWMPPPTQRSKKRNNHNNKRLLNYLMLEMTLASPYNPRIQLIARIHHRSGAFGIYGAGTMGSMSLGCRFVYLFR